MSKRIAVVTGANRGIGYEIARQLAGVGIDVIGTSRDAAAGQTAAELLGVRFAALDVADAAMVDALPEQLARALDVSRGSGGDTAAPGIDILVNNAGISMHGFDQNVARRTLDVNFYGAMRVTERLLPLMRAGGRIVMVSSGLGELRALSPSLQAKFLDPSLTRAALIALVESFVRDVAEGTHAEQGWPSSAYRVSKIAMNALTRVLARELRDDPRRILVNAGSPGWARTAMGGSGAPRSAAEGARTLSWLATLPEGASSGGFFEDEREIAW